MELRGAAGDGVRSSSHELSGVVGDTAVVLGGLVSASELFLVVDHVVTLVIFSGSGTLQSEGSNQVKSLL